MLGTVAVDAGLESAEEAFEDSAVLGGVVVLDAVDLALSATVLASPFEGPPWDLGLTVVSNSEISILHRTSLGFAITSHKCLYELDIELFAPGEWSRRTSIAPTRRTCFRLRG